MRDEEDFRALLALWYHRDRRQLPWREQPEPYRVWVSEIMLQQTQVATVIPYFERFLAAFPTPEALALAPEADVLSLWSGLGYYRRARMLHKAAQEVVSVHQGNLPTCAKALETLPGIGPYTARAIASIAFGEAVPVLDGNVARVLSRWMRYDVAIDSSAGQKVLWAWADDVLDRDDPSSHNQAMMELGALICTPGRPQCHRCPVQSLCGAGQEGDWASYPQKKPKKKSQKLHEVAVYCQREDGQFLMARRPPSGLLGALWELPGGTLSGPDPAACARRVLKERLQIDVEVGAFRTQVKHVFSHRNLTLDVYAGSGSGNFQLREFYDACQWVDLTSLGKLPLSTLTRKVLTNLGVLDG